jgi:poly(hydroxyalkanoate) depolymerase family esterase
MNALPKIDMMEVTRLTREGRLDAAMAILRGVPSGMPQSEFAPKPRVGTIERVPPTLDMAAPRIGTDDAWTWPQINESQSVGRPLGARQPLKSAAALHGFPDVMRRLGSANGLHGMVQRHAVPVPDGAQFEERNYSNEAGGRIYKLYVPSGYGDHPVPLVVMLHGCTQSPDDFALGTRMNELAEKNTFLVAYPAQSRSANVSKCWNWFNEGHQQRDQGEPSLIAGITREILADFSVEAGRVYIAGLSAGGAAAAIMGSTYPDLFAAVGVHSGLACGAAANTLSAFAAMRGGGTVGLKKSNVATIVFHGDRDTTVNPVNGDQVFAQAKVTADLQTTVSRGAAPGGIRYTRTVRADENGRPMLEQWILHGAGHAWSGGSSAGSYTEPRGPDASREMVRFFLQSRSRSV